MDGHRPIRMHAGLLIRSNLSSLDKGKNKYSSLQKITKMKKWMLVFFLITIQASFGFAQDRGNADVQAIRNARKASNASIAIHDLNGFAQFWLDDFVQI